MLAYIPYPDWIRPEIIPGLGFRWYGLMYIVAFGVAYFFFMRQVKERGNALNKDDLGSFFIWGIIGLVLGARIFGTLVYGGSDTYWRQPWLIFWPFSTETPGKFVGLSGMSYHGGAIGGVIGAYLCARRKKLDFLDLGDMASAAIPFGYAFGRLGNFINAELYGRVTASPLGMLFPGLPESERFPASETWVTEMAGKAGIPVKSMLDLVNLPRHPSQLYEALFEGVVLGCLLWFLARKWRPFRGFVIGCYFIGYGLFRFFLEYLRAPDGWMGYIVNFSGRSDLPVNRFVTPWAFSMGQLLCFLMIAGGAAFLAYRARKERKAAAQAMEAAVQKKQNDPRKLRKKLR